MKPSYWRPSPFSETRSQLKYKYGLSIEAYNLLWCLQRGSCAICGKPETRLSKFGKVQRLQVDHDHVTGEVRGLLCNDCNTGIGRFRESPTELSNAIQYLQYYAS